MYVMELYFFSKKTLLYGLRFYRGMIFWTIDHHQNGHLGKKKSALRSQVPQVDSKQKGTQKKNKPIA